MIVDRAIQCSLFCACTLILFKTIFRTVDRGFIKKHFTTSSGFTFQEPNLQLNTDLVSSLQFFNTYKFCFMKLFLRQHSIFIRLNALSKPICNYKVYNTAAFFRKADILHTSCKLYIALFYLLSPNISF